MRVSELAVVPYPCATLVRTVRFVLHRARFHWSATSLLGHFPGAFGQKRNFPVWSGALYFSYRATVYMYCAQYLSWIEAATTWLSGSDGPRPFLTKTTREVEDDAIRLCTAYHSLLPLAP
jgi:hypothetical protein